jgi:hypothetical protein
MKKRSLIELSICPSFVSVYHYRIFTAPKRVRESGDVNSSNTEKMRAMVRIKQRAEW